MFLLLLYISTATCSPTGIDTVDLTTKLNALIFSTRGLRKRSLPEWSSVLEESDSLMKDIGYPELSRRIRGMKWKGILLATQFRDSEFVFREMSSNGGEVPPYIESTEAAKSAFLDCLNRILENLRDLAEAVNGLSPDLTLKISNACKTAKLLKTFVARSDTRKKRQSAAWHKEYCFLADSLSTQIDDADIPLTELTDSDFLDFVRSFDGYGVVNRLLKSALSRSLRHHLAMLGYDSTLLRLFSKESVVNMRAAIALTYISDTLSSLVGSFLFATGKISDPRFAKLWGQAKQAHTDGKHFKSKVIMDHVGGEDHWVTDCRAWRKEQLKQVYLISQLARLV